MLWTGTRNRKGYGQFWHNGKMMQAHRFAYEQAHGPVPIGLVVMHKCHNPSCVADPHLVPGTNRENSHERDRLGRGQRGEHHAHAVLTENVVRQLRVRYEAGETAGALARELGVKHTTAAAAINRLTWRHVA